MTATPRLFATAVAALVLLATLAGCSGTKAPLAAAPAPPEPTDEGPWRFLRAEFTGEADTGLFLFHPLDPPLPTATLRRNVVIESTAPDGSLDAFLIEPQLLPMRLDKKGVFFYQQPQWNLGVDGFKWEVSDELPAGSGNDLLGVLMVFVSSEPWKLSLDLEVVDGEGGTAKPKFSTIAPGSIHRGQPAAPGLATANAFDFKVEVALQGFLHYNVIRKPSPNHGVRVFDVSFPNGYACRDPQVEYGAGPGPLAPGTTSRVDYAGSFRSPKGTFQSRILYADQSTAVDLALVSLALDFEKLPAFFQAHYIGPRYGPVAARTGCG